MIKLQLDDVVFIEINNKAYREIITMCDYVQRKYRAGDFWIKKGDNEFCVEDIDGHIGKLLQVLRKDENNNLKTIYDFRNSDKTVEPDTDEEKPFHPLERGNVGVPDVAYEKYMQLQHENEELKNIIVELNKKLYGKNN